MCAVAPRSVRRRNLATRDAGAWELGRDGKTNINARTQTESQSNKHRPTHTHTQTDTKMETEEVPQSQPLPGSKMVPNSAGGFSWQVDDMRRLRRFLCLGSEGGTYYIGEKELGRENAECIMRLIAAGQGPEVVKEIVDFSIEGRAAKQNPIIFALALCARDKNEETKRAAYEVLNRVCRIPTHLFAFVEFCEGLSVGTGWGRSHRRTIQAWYNEKKGKPLAIAVTKYRQRGGWSHLDVLRLSHIRPINDEVACVCKYVVKGVEECKAQFAGKGREVDETLAFLEAVEAAKTADEATIVKFIREYGLVREHVPTTHLNSIPVSVLHILWYLFMWFWM